MFRLLAYIFRAGCWSRVRREHLERHPRCAACGRDENLQVHHIVPVSVDPSKECDPDNCLTMCADPCHWVFGHLMDYRRHNEHVVEDCAKYWDRMKASMLTVHYGSD